MLIERSHEDGIVLWHPPGIVPLGSGWVVFDDDDTVLFKATHDEMRAAIDAAYGQGRPCPRLEGDSWIISRDGVDWNALVAPVAEIGDHGTPLEPRIAVGADRIVMAGCCSATNVMGQAVFVAELGR